ncbi:peptidylprolyl isomerase [Rheinheimera nanhaiensis]|uniref:peptidylprolyl isomerase n=1 Tax=Rheinheimera nanhaiensis E407-8 TaxID=562729 RepID=I1DZP5_9GAMM|nr:peptidylprolyl isomerase [Rheinheimera nanhaiensis]GAB59523.1 foldase protein PrsA [Rheinheimera nanhaiensis E407-8]
MKAVIFTVAALVLIQISGCSKKPEHFATVGEQNVTVDEVNAYLTYKRIDNANTELTAKAAQHYLNNLALIQAIEQQDSVDMLRINAELTELKKDLLLNTYLQQYLEQAVTETAMRNYYADNQQNYQQRSAKVAHILFRVTPEMTEAERQAKYSKALEAYSKARTGDNFAELAKAYSEDSISAGKGGQLGWLQHGAVSPLFSAQVFEKLTAGEISEPVLTEFGYHLIKLEQEPNTVKQSFEAVSGDIRRILRAMAKDAELERLRQSVTIKQHDTPL